ncbi:papain family cysteine protease [Methanobrevibacter oralis]|uniref:Papain family cysteine protease n=1 Tax=Methanobrevibacter oralis TaxID=66851 RepID=A0A165ZTM4_METOA|nr:C1 family peptidase [Methanobrevibacter oralis]KZX11143.1 papain family cysteine protease [Methanobrevibacter oralis]
MIKIKKIFLLTIFLLFFIIIPVSCASDNLTKINSNISYEDIKDNSIVSLDDGDYDLNFTYIKINDSHLIYGQSQNKTSINSNDCKFDIVDNASLSFKNLSLNGVDFKIKSTGKLYFHNTSLNNCNFRIYNDCELFFDNVSCIYSNIFKNNFLELRFSYSNNLYANINDKEFLFKSVRLFKGNIDICIDTIFKINKANLINSSIKNQGILILGNVSSINSIFENNELLNASNCIFTNNFDENIIKTTSFHSTCNLINCTFINNTATFGGAINANNYATVNIINSIFISNNAYRYGGVIYAYNKVKLKIINSIFNNGQATRYGGAIACENSEMDIINSTFFNDSSINDSGGAIYLINSRLNANKLNINSCFSNFGGAICSLNSNITIINFKGYNNYAKYGGAIYHLYSSFSLNNSILNNNSALNGGALFIDNSSSLNLNNISFINNKASKFAGALYLLLNPVKKISNLRYINNKALKYNDEWESSIPSLFIGNNNYTLIYSNSIFSGFIPSYYSLIDKNLITSVKDQKDSFNCWAFASLAALESCILKATGDRYDLSEENMKNLMELYSDYGWKMKTNEGGFDDMAIGYLVSWLGPINEYENPFDVKSVLSPVLNSLFHIQNIVFLKRNNFTDNKAIKEAILKYGAVSTKMYHFPSYLKDDLNYYYDGNDRCNHAVCIVGWDDNYPKNNFKKTPKGNGAWIVKNSWGNSSGNRGYFYVSYYDTKFAQVGQNEASYTFILNDTVKYDKNYQYDIVGKTDYLFTNKNTIYYKNIFNSTDNEFLSAVSTYFEKKCSWELFINVNNKLKLTKKGTSTAGYYTIDLGSYIPIRLGDTFEVIFKIKASNVAFPISEKVLSNKLLYPNDKSFFSYDGKKWINLYNFKHKYLNHTYNSQVACIKVFTILNEINTTLNLNIYQNHNKLNLIADVYNEFGCIVQAGNVVFLLDDLKYTVPIKNGKASLNHVFMTKGDRLISARYINSGYNSFKKEKSISINNIKFIPTTLSRSNLTVYYKSGVLTLILKDYYTNPIADALISINKKTLKTNKYGIVKFNLDLNVGLHELTAYFQGKGDYLSSNSKSIIKVLSTIKANDLSRGYNSAYDYKATFLDSKGKLLTNKKVSFIINNKKYHVKTDSKGVGILKIKLVRGNYIIKSINPQTGEKISKILKIIPRLKENKNVANYFGSKTIYKVRAYGDNGKVLGSGVSITFKINSKTYKIKTDKKGYATLKIKLKTSKYTITSVYKGFKVVNKITIKPVLITKNLFVKKTKKIKFTAKLVNSKGKIVKNKKITFKINHKTYKIKTNSKGIAILKLKNLKLGKYKIYSIYSKSKIKNTITIKK